MKPRTVTINAVGNGVIVAVGCQTFVFEDVTKALLELSRYYASPEQVEKEYTEKFKLFNGAPEPQAPPVRYGGQSPFDGGLQLQPGR